MNELLHRHGYYEKNAVVRDQTYCIWLPRYWCSECQGRYSPLSPSLFPIHDPNDFLLCQRAISLDPTKRDPFVPVLSDLTGRIILDMTLEQAAEAVMAWVRQSNMAVSVIEKKTESERYNDDIQALKEMVSKQNELLKELMMRLDQQQKYIEESLKKRDELLMQSLKESMETRKMIAAVKEEEGKKKKGFWSRLFGK